MVFTICQVLLLHSRKCLIYMHLVGLSQFLALKSRPPVLRNIIHGVMAIGANVQPLGFAENRAAVLPILPGMLGLLGVTMLAHGAPAWAERDLGLDALPPGFALGAQHRRGNARGHGRLGLDASAHSRAGAVVLCHGFRVQVVCVFLHTVI